MTADLLARLRRCVAALAGLAVICWSLNAQTPKATEYQVKAAYLARFVKYVEWPAGSAATPDEPYPICVLGPDPFGLALDAALSGETAGDGKSSGTNAPRHPLIPRRIASPRDAGNCRVVYISGDDSDIKKALAGLERISVLTVSDYPDFLKRGGMIQFVLVDGHVRFDVNIQAARRAGLNLSSDLLQVAHAVGKK
jgi:hypothetical protein